MHAFRRPAALVAALVISAAALSSQAQPREPLTIMSFNIRYGTAKDGENRGRHGETMLFDVIREQRADLIGLQEALDAQIAEIVTAVPGYAIVGVGRDDARSRGSISAILFRQDRFHVAEAGTFWFSDTPSVPASKSWGNNITRICTWARFIDRDGRAFWHFNVHLDHQSQPSRERSTELLRQRIAARAFPTEPVIVTGDFNVGEANPAHCDAHRRAERDGSPPFLDTFRVRYPDENDVGTFTGFKFGATTGERSTTSSSSPAPTCWHAEIVRTSRDNRYPSDHFPVVARVRLTDR